MYSKRFNAEEEENPPSSIRLCTARTRLQDFIHLAEGCCPPFMNDQQELPSTRQSQHPLDRKKDNIKIVVVVGAVEMLETQNKRVNTRKTSNGSHGIRS